MTGSDGLPGETGFDREPICVVDGISDFLGADVDGRIETDYDATPTLTCAGPLLRAGWRIANDARASLVEARVEGRLRAVWVGGGGRNVLAQRLASRIETSIVVDPSRTQLAQTPRVLGSETILARAVGEDLPILDSWADLTELQSVIDHVIDPSTAVAEAIRVTRPGGLLLVSVTNDGSWFRRLARLARRATFEDNDTHAHRFVTAEIRQLLVDAGLTDVVVSTVMYLRVPSRLDRTPARIAPRIARVADFIGTRIWPEGGGIIVGAGTVPA